MPRSGVIVDVFLSSPGDVKTERDLAEKIVNELNRDFADDGFTVNLLKWENTALSGIGADPQDVVDRVLFHRYDLYIGIIGHKFGTPARGAGSGTEAEFNRAVERYEQGDRSIDISFFVLNRPLPDDIDTAELERIRAFRKRLTASGVLALKYETSEDFKAKIERHIREYAKDKVKAYLSSVGGEEIAGRMLDKLQAMVAVLGQLSHAIVKDISPYLGEDAPSQRVPPGRMANDLRRRLDTAEKILATVYSETRADIRNMAADWLISQSQSDIRSGIELVNGRIPEMREIVKDLVFRKDSYPQLPAPFVNVFNRHAVVVDRALRFLQGCESNFRAIVGR